MDTPTENPAQPDPGPAKPLMLETLQHLDAAAKSALKLVALGVESKTAPKDRVIDFAAALEQILRASETVSGRQAVGWIV